MNKKFTFVGFLVLLLMFTVSSCTKPVGNKGNFTFKQIQVDQQAHLFNNEENPACHIQIDFNYPISEKESGLADSLTTFLLASSLGDKYMNLAPQEAVQHYVKDYITEYQKDLESMYAEDKANQEPGTELGAWYSYTRNVKVEFPFYENNLLSYLISFDEYTGGAHGIYMYEYVNIDLEKRASILLEDLFVGDYTEELTKLLWEQLMDDEEVNSREELEERGYGSTGDLAPTRNFLLNKEGITFCYNVYEIAPYSMGAIRIKLPFEKISHLLGSSEIIKDLLK